MYYAVLFLPFRKRLEQQQKMLEEDRKRRQFEEQKQKLRLLSSVKPKVSLSPHLVLLVFPGMSTARFTDPLDSRYPIVLCSDGGEEPRWRLGGNQRQPGRFQQRCKDAPHSIISDPEARYLSTKCFLLKLLALKKPYNNWVIAGSPDHCIIFFT